MPPQDAYLESQVLAAEPMELVRLLYRGAGDAVRLARTHLDAGGILERSRQISKAHAILSQLTVSLDHARGGALSRGLAELYDYMQRRLLDANRLQQAEPLAEVERLLTTLLEGWDQVSTTPPPPASYGSLPGPDSEEEFTGSSSHYALFAPHAAPEYASQSWSF